MQKVVVTKKLPVDISAYLSDFRVEANTTDEALPLLRFRQMASDADGIISCSSDIIDKTLLDSSPKLKVIANYSTSFTNIDIEYAKKKGITVCAAGNALTQDIAELLFALLISASKNIALEDSNARNKTTKQPPSTKAAGFYKKTLGIIGMDSIGQAAAKIATGFSMDTIYFDATRNYQSELLLGSTYATLDEIMGWSDFIIISTIFNNFINEKITSQRFKQMKKSAIIACLDISSAIDIKDFISSLKENTIAGAGISLNNIPKEEADILKTMNNVTLLTNDKKSSAMYAQEEMAKICAESIKSILADGIAPSSAITI